MTGIVLKAKQARISWNSPLQLTTRVNRTQKVDCFLKKGARTTITMAREEISRRHSHRYPLLEYEKGYSDDESCETSIASSQARDSKLVIVFALLVIFGAGNAVFGKLQAVPMYNYPNFLNLFGVALYVPICFSYVSFSFVLLCCRRLICSLT